MPIDDYCSDWPFRKIWRESGNRLWLWGNDTVWESVGVYDYYFRTPDCCWGPRNRTSWHLPRHVLWEANCWIFICDEYFYCIAMTDELWIPNTLLAPMHEVSDLETLLEISLPQCDLHLQSNGLAEMTLRIIWHLTNLRVMSAQSNKSIK